MSLLNVLIYPDSRLRNIAKPVIEFNASLEELVNNMADTMYQANGIGLAATQVNICKRVIVIDLSEEQNELLTLINPIITEKHDEQTYDEGCLSIPGVYAKVTRAKQITLSAQDITGETISLQTSDLLAVCIQHEIDHLDGKVFVDYLSLAKRERIKNNY